MHKVPNMFVCELSPLGKSSNFECQEIIVASHRVGIHGSYLLEKV